MLWFSDLTVADPYYVLPVLTSAILWLSAEYGVADGMQGQPPETVARLKNGMRFVAVLLVPICVTMPTVCLLRMLSVGQPQLICTGRHELPAC